MLLMLHNGAEDGIRTRDPHLGKVMRYRCATSAWATTLSRRPCPIGGCHEAWTWCFTTRLPPHSGDGQRRVQPRYIAIVEQDETTAILSRSFGEVAGEYNRLRSGPSSEALDWLIPEGATDILEIGAGTGILTRLLSERVAHLTAVEPDERMRAVLAAGQAEP